MRIAAAVLQSGKVNPHFGRTSKMALADVEEGQITRWQEVDTPFPEMHGDQPHHHEGGHKPNPSHQETIKQFLVEHDVDVVFVHHAGPGLQKVIDETGIKVVTGAQGNARDIIQELITNDVFQG